MKVAIFGASGMLGSMLFRFLSAKSDIATVGVIRAANAPRELTGIPGALIAGMDVTDESSISRVFDVAQPDVVINAVGLVKQLQDSKDPIQAIVINSLLPHRLHAVAVRYRARLIHVSTDCVFSGRVGQYKEDDVPDATDIYGRSKLLGEVDGERAVTLRTSIIGPEIFSSHGLLQWFMGQEESVKGYASAVFSGLPTVELARVIGDYVLPNPGLRGLYHVAAAPIDKFSLLSLIKAEYGRTIDIVSDKTVSIDRSLDGARFNRMTGFMPRSWPDMIKTMKHWDYSNI